MTQRDWQKDMDTCVKLKEWHENDWMTGTEEGTGIWIIHEVMPDEPCQYVAECENELVVDFIMTAHEALPYWLQEAKERGEREQRLKEEIEKVVKDILPWGDAETAIEKAINHFKYLSSTPLYPDTPAPKEEDNQ